MSSSALKTPHAFDFLVNFEAMLQKLDREFEELPRAPVERFSFSFDGLNFDIKRMAGKDSQRFLMRAEIGYMPFSIESIERREAIKSIIMATQSLPNVHFTVDTTSKIAASALLEIPPVVQPDSIFYPLTLFMQEARPFIQLIGQYLCPTPFIPAPETESKHIA